MRHRRCLATGDVRPTEALVRFVVDGDGMLVADVAERLPGRGLWLTADRAVLERACRRNLFAKAARARVIVPPDLIALVETRLLRHCLDGIALARRAGQAVCGLVKTQMMLVSGRAGLRLIARDGGLGERRGLLALAPAVPLVESLTAPELGRPFARDHVVHAAFAAGPLASRIEKDAVRLAALRHSGDNATTKHGNP